MSTELLVSYYAGRSVPPVVRCANLVQSEPRLTWVSLLLADYPNADVFLGGGTVRDALLGIVPDDLDLVVRNVEPKDLEAWLRRHGACQYVEAGFGTFKFAPHGAGVKDPIDIALPRKERFYDGHRGGRKDVEAICDARLPIKEDLARRDFTINAIAYNIQRGTLIDPYGGLRDLEHGIVRTVLDAGQRFSEDATRILRGLRFASQLRFAIESGTWEELLKRLDSINTKVLKDDGTHRYLVAREAIGREFLLGFLAHPIHTLKLWREAGAMKLFMPEVSELEQVQESDGEHAFEKTLRALTLLTNDRFLEGHGLRRVSGSVLVAGLMAFMQYDRRRNAKRVCSDLYFHQFSRVHRAHVDCAEVHWLLDHLHDFEDADPASMRPSAFEKLYCHGRGRNLLALIHATRIASGAHSPGRERLHIAKHLVNKFCDDSPSKLLRGSDLIPLGLEPGPVFREILDEVRDAQLLGTVCDKDGAIEFVRERVRGM